MSSDTHEPASGTPHPDPLQPHKVMDEVDITGASTRSAASSSTPSTASGDELNLLLAESMAQPEPDPLLGEYTPGKPPEAASQPPLEGMSAGSFDAVSIMNAFTDPHPVDPVSPSHSAATATAPVPVPDFEAPTPATLPLGSSSSDVVNPLEALGVSAGSDSSYSPASFDAFPHMDLSAPPSRADETKPSELDEDEEYDDLPPRRSSLGTMLLFSYASAVTLGLIWVLWTGRRLHESTEDAQSSTALDARPDPGSRADRSRRMTAPPALADDHVTTLGKALRLGGLEATPLEIIRGSVELRPSFGEKRIRPGGNESLKLKLRLKNLSADSIYFPLDESFLRERRREVKDSLIETSDGQQIEMYPLAIASELSIVGQEFRELRPGESYETWVVSAPDAADRKTPDMTWRIRLRTGIEQTDTLGVRFHDTEIKTKD